MVLELNEVKKYLRLDEDYTEEDDILILMIYNAGFYIEDAGIAIDSENEKKMKKIKLLALVIVTDFYENRELTTKVTEKTRKTIDSLFMQLKYWGD